MSNTKIRLNQIQQDGASTGQFIQFDGTDWLASSSAVDNTFFIVDNSDNTKKAAFEVSGISASTTRTFTFPDVTGILALTTGTGGANRITFWNDNDTITSASTLLTNGTNVAINTSITTSYLLKAKQNTTTDGILVERSSDTRGVAIYNDGTATVESVGGGNLTFKSGTSTTITFATGGGGGQISQLAITPSASVTSVFTNSNFFNINGTYAPTTAGGSFHGFLIGINVNQTGAADQLVSGLYINPTLTAVASAGFKGVHYGPSTQTFLYQPSGTSVVNHLIGNLGVGTGTTSPSAKIEIVGNGATSSTYGLKVHDSSGTNNALTVRDDGRVGILTASPSYPLDINATGGIRVTVGTTAQRPTGAAGVMRFNTDINIFEGYDGSDWQSMMAGGASNLDIITTPSTNTTMHGAKLTFTANENHAFGDAVYIDSSTGKAKLANATTISTATAIGVATGSVTANNDGSYLVLGIARNDSWSWTVNGIIYLSTSGTTGNTLTQTAPTGTNKVVQILGVATHANRLYINPQLVQIELA